MAKNEVKVLCCALLLGWASFALADDQPSTTGQITINYNSFGNCVAAGGDVDGTYIWQERVSTLRGLQGSITEITQPGLKVDVYYSATDANWECTREPGPNPQYHTCRNLNPGDVIDFSDDPNGGSPIVTMNGVPCPPSD